MLRSSASISCASAERMIDSPCPVHETATLPDGSTKPLLWIQDWDFNWQTTYAFKQPVKLPAGSCIDVVSYYDNSADNPRNPNDPPRVVTWGEQTTDEMALLIVSFTRDSIVGN